MPLAPALGQPAPRLARASAAGPAADPLDSLRPTALLDNAEDAGEFVVIDGVPIFDAHVGDDGTEYDERLLAQIAENNNRRIRDTGDFCPLVIGHTPEDPSSDKDPPLVGMAGPFKVGMFGDEKPRPCIFAKFWVWKHKLRQFKEHPRRSVELWPENAPEERFFDPIALLGAETPRRALGLAYAKAQPGRKQPIRYEMAAAAAPSGTNTFLPSGGLAKRDAGDEPTKYQQAPAMPFSPEDVQQLVEALKPTIQTLVSEAMQAVQNPEPDMTGLDDDFGGDDLAFSEPGNLDPMADPMADPAGDPMGDPLAGGDAGREDASLNDEGLDDVGPGDGFDDSGLENDADPIPAEDEDPERYANMGAATAGAPLANLMNKAAPVGPNKFQKQRDEWKLRYQKEKAGREQAIAERDRYKKERDEALKAQRYAKRLADAINLRNEGYTLEPEEEVGDFLHLSDAQWDSHVAHARVRYQKVPLGTVAIPRDEAMEYAAREQRARFAEKAEKVATRYQKTPGKKHITYAHVLKHIIANKGQLNEELLAQEVA